MTITTFAKNKANPSMFTFNCKGRLLVIEQPVVMGIINVSPDSFYENSTANTITDVLKKAEQMLNDGAVILDIGGQSTKPGSKEISVDLELSLVIPAIEAIAKQFPQSFISIDTYRAEVAVAAADTGACIVNDISAGMQDAKMIETVAALQLPYIAMHSKGTPATMQQHAIYDDLMLEILEFFIEKTHECTKAGIKDIILDPGFGFAKSIGQNFTLLKNMGVLKILQKPLMAGLSRKSTIYKTLQTTPEKALNGTTVLNTLALQNGASILRVHDTREAMETIELWKNYSNG